MINKQITPYYMVIERYPSNATKKIHIVSEELRDKLHESIMQDNVHIVAAPINTTSKIFKNILKQVEKDGYAPLLDAKQQPLVKSVIAKKNFNSSAGYSYIIVEVEKKGLTRKELEKLATKYESIPELQFLKPSLNKKFYTVGGINYEYKIAPMLEKYVYDAHHPDKKNTLTYIIEKGIEKAGLIDCTDLLGLKQFNHRTMRHPLSNVKDIHGSGKCEIIATNLKTTPLDFMNIVNNTITINKINKVAMSFITEDLNEFKNEFPAFSKLWKTSAMFNCPCHEDSEGSRQFNIDSTGLYPVLKSHCFSSKCAQPDMNFVETLAAIDGVIVDQKFLNRVAASLSLTLLADGEVFDNIEQSDVIDPTDIKNKKSLLEEEIKDFIESNTEEDDFKQFFIDGDIWYFTNREWEVCDLEDYVIYLYKYKLSKFIKNLYRTMSDVGFKSEITSILKSIIKKIGKRETFPENKNPGRYLPFSDKLFDLKTQEARDYEASDLIFRKYNTKYPGKNIDTTIPFKFLSSIVAPKDVIRLCGMLASSMMHTPGRIYYCLGGSNNGKTLTQQFFNESIGNDLVSEISMEQLVTDQFSLIDLQFKTCNSVSEMPETIAFAKGNPLDKLKKIAGKTGKPAIISARGLYKSGIKFPCYATFTFSGNEINYAEYKKAAIDRLEIIEFPYCFINDESFPQKLITPKNCQALLAYLIPHCINIYNNVDYNKQYYSGKVYVRKMVNIYKNRFKTFMRHNYRDNFNNSIMYLDLKQLYQELLGEEESYNTDISDTILINKIKKAGYKIEDSNDISKIRVLGITPIIQTIPEDIFGDVKEEEAVEEAVDLYAELNKKLKPSIDFLNKNGVVYDFKYALKHNITETHLDQHTRFMQASKKSKDGKIRGNWHTDVAKTGRISCTNIELQGIHNILKPYVIPDKVGDVFLKSDYDQNELRIVAVQCQDHNLQKLINSKKYNTYKFIASKFYNKKYINVTKKEIKISKIIALALNYGLQPASIVKKFKFSMEEAQNIIAVYKKMFRNVAQVIDNAQSETNVILPYSKKKIFCSRIPQVLNTPIQGAGAEMIKLAQIDIFQQLIPGEAKLVLSVHDEIVLQVGSEYIEKYTKILKNSMEKAGKIVLESIVENKTDSFILDTPVSINVSKTLGGK